jgi:hypothetical protein
LFAQRTPIKKLCRNRGLVLQDETVTTGTQKIMEEETVPMAAHEAMEEKMEAAVAQEVMKDKKMVKDRRGIHLTCKRRRLFQDE